MISAGRVLIKPRGEWNAETTYHMLDLVNHKGYAWLAKRTVIGIEPSNDYPDYWHNMLDIEKIVAEAMAGTLAEEVSELLKDELSEARYVTDLLTEYDVPTFVYWNAETANTPYTAGLTSSSEGYALVYGNSISAWANGETFTYGANGWDKPINASGGTMSGPLGLGGGKGSVSADEDGTFIEVKNGDDVKQIKVTNTSLEEAAKLVSKENGVTKVFNLFGEHNPDKIADMGFSKIVIGSYIGTGKCGYGKNGYTNQLTFEEEPQLVFVFAKVYRGIYGFPTLTLIKGCNSSQGYNHGYNEVDYGENIVTFEGNTVSWYHNDNEQSDGYIRMQQNEKDTEYFYVALIKKAR